MSHRVTIADVAAKAGVSMMTVSRAINNKAGVSEATRERILQIAQEMGFQPSEIARGLATKRTATIGLVVPDIANPFFARIARGVEDVAYAHHYNVFLLNSSEQIEREQKALDSLWAQRVDGLIWCSSRLEQSELLHYLERFSHVVLINRVLDVARPGVITMSVDDVAGAYQAVAHFVEQGRRNIGFAAGPAYSISGQRRLQGFLAACGDLGVETAVSHIQHGPPTRGGGHQAATALITKNPDLQAILAYNDLVAVGVMQACLENGRSVPGDIAVIGFDDIPLASLVTPSLSTLHIDKYELGAEAMTTLLQLMNQADHSHSPNQTIQPELILRQSTTRDN
jgi:LacI family transcriptional regulator